MSFFAYKNPRDRDQQSILNLKYNMNLLREQASIYFQERKV